jgi:CRISPR-associated protein Csx17
MNKIYLPGCTPEPLSNYLKALGVLRVLVELGQDSQAKGYWEDDVFVLMTTLHKGELIDFLLEKYQPTPLISPWNGSTGFYPKDNRKTLDSLLNSQGERLKEYRKTIQIGQGVVNQLNLSEQPEDEMKKLLLMKLRNCLPDRVIQWLDTCALITEKKLELPPLMGTGGNDGNFEFSRTFMQQLQEVMDFQTGKSTLNSANLLQGALLGDAIPKLPFSGVIGQFNPIAAGGANAAPGYQAKSRVNPWDFILMLEGTLLFTAGVSRRYGAINSGDLTYPFTVKGSNFGYGSASDNDQTRGELWLPLWLQPTGIKELQILFREGRAKVGKRTAKTGVDFALAVSGLGVDRGLSEFVRYSFQIRNGLSYFAIPLGRFQPQQNPKIELLAELDSWLLKFGEVASNNNAPASVKRTYRQLENAIFEWTQYRVTNVEQSGLIASATSPAQREKLLNILITLGAVEKSLSQSLTFIQEKYLKPIPLLRKEWVNACNDESVEFRLALSLAGKGLQQKIIPFHEKLLLINAPFSSQFRSRLVKVRGNQWADQEDGITLWQEASLVQNLITLIKRENLDSEPQKTRSDDFSQNPEKLSRFFSNYANLSDICLWIDGKTNDARIDAIARGLSLIKFHHSVPLPPQDKHSQLYPPIAYSLLAVVQRRLIKANHHQRVDSLQNEVNYNEAQKDVILPKVPGLFAKISGGDCVGATKLAAQRLHASGLKPAIREGIYEPRDRALRIAAALAFPLSEKDASFLLNQIQQRELS